MNSENHVPSHTPTPPQTPALPPYVELKGDRLVIDLTQAETATTSGCCGLRMTVRPAGSAPTPAADEAPRLPSWARLSARGNLTIDLDQVETFTIAAPAERRRLLIGPRVNEKPANSLADLKRAFLGMPLAAETGAAEASTSKIADA